MRGNSAKASLRHRNLAGRSILPQVGIAISTERSADHSSGGIDSLQRRQSAEWKRDVARGRFRFARIDANGASLRKPAGGR